jgi:acetyl esterase/lipase
MSFRAVYKILDNQEIDADIYLPPARRNGNGKPFPLFINIHGGAFMLGSSEMVNTAQVQDCLDRGWIVVVPNHRLCPLVDLLEGPMRDCRDLLAWIHEGGLHDAVLRETAGSYLIDLDHIFAFGTSSGGTLALSLVRVPRISILKRVLLTDELAGLRSTPSRHRHPRLLRTL